MAAARRLVLGSVTRSRSLMALVDTFTLYITMTTSWMTSSCTHFRFTLLRVELEESRWDVCYGVPPV